MSSMLADVVNAGTAYKARQAGFTLPAAGKTGTTNDYVDAWFVGYTPHVITGVWVGFDQPQTIVSNGYAGELAVPIWAAFMKVATKDDKPDWFDRPSNVVGVNVCRLSGMLPNAGCDHVQVVDDAGNRRDPVDGLHGLLRQGVAADDDLSAPSAGVVPRCARRRGRRARRQPGTRRSIDPAARANPTTATGADGHERRHAGRAIR